MVESGAEFNKEYTQEDTTTKEVQDLQKDTVESLIMDETIPLKEKEDILIAQFDAEVIKKLIDRKHLDKMSLHVYEFNLHNNATLFRELVQEAITSGQKLSGNFGQYIAGLISLRQIIAKQAGENIDEFSVTDFFQQFLGIDIMGDQPVEDIIDHWDPTKCYCDVPIKCKALLEDSYTSTYASVKAHGLNNMTIPSKATY